MQGSLVTQGDRVAMKYFITISLFISAAVFAWVNINAQEAEPAGATESLTGSVVAIIDGDSFKIQTEHGLQRVELHGIDAPEQGQAWGEMATYYLTDLIDGRDVQVLKVADNEYGDIIGIVEIDGYSINRLMLTEGYAWAKRGYSQDKKWIGLESLAREGQLGLWRQGEPLSPWEWRELKLKG